MAAIVGLSLAFTSALAGSLGFLLRYRGAIAAPDVDVRRPLRSAVDLFRSKWWSIGYGFAILAYLLHVGALSLAALSMVQAVLAGGLVLLAVIAERYFGFQLERRQWTGVVLATAGLAGLALTGEVRSGQESAGYSPAAMIAFECALAAIGTGLIMCHRLGRLHAQLGVVLGLAAGLLFTITHVAVKALSGELDSGVEAMLLSPYILIAIAGGVVGFFASARSLQLGPAVPVIAVTSIAGNASAIPAGIVVFGDPLGADAPSTAFRAFAFVLVVVAATLIPGPTRAARHSRGEGPKHAPAPA
jgi:drug/metabolite transporter (DMT)-like permease